jgi:hypothetical protein
VPLNGGVNNSVWWFHGYKPSDVASNNATHLTIPAGKDKGDSAYVTKLLLLTNPTRPVYSVPVAIREMVDLTTLFSLAAKSFVSFVGGAYLNYRFGWLSFIRDIKTLSSIVEAVQSRVREYNSLLMKGGLRRAVQLDAFGTGSKGTRTLQSSFGVTLEATYSKSTRVKVWGSVRWYPANIQLIPTEPADRWLLAVRQVFDLEELDGATLWDLIPWSWLIDYFTNIGDLLAASEGRELVVPRDICIMRETTTIDAGTRKKLGTAGDKISGGGYNISRITKARTTFASPPSSAQAFGELLSFSEYKVVLALLAKFRG